jgi:hypothetical protein
LRLKLRELLEITGIGHHGGEFFEGVELVHRGLAQVCKVGFKASG